jgi:hypothetical protein
MPHDMGNVVLKHRYLTKWLAFLRLAQTKRQYRLSNKDAQGLSKLGMIQFTLVPDDMYLCPYLLEFWTLLRHVLEQLCVNGRFKPLQADPSAHYPAHNSSKKKLPQKKT